jgi:hypothetical protein
LDELATLTEKFVDDCTNRGLVDPHPADVARRRKVAEGPDANERAREFLRASKKAKEGGSRKLEESGTKRKRGTPLNQENKESREEKDASQQEKVIPVQIQEEEGVIEKKRRKKHHHAHTQ